MLLTKACPETGLATLLLGAGLVAWLRHLAMAPQAVMFAAIALGDNFALTVGGLTGSLIRHYSSSIIPKIQP